MPDDRLPISDLDEALELSDAAQFPYTQNNGGTLTTYKALLTQIAAKIVEDMTFAGITLPVSAGVKSVENTLNYLLDSVGGDPNGNISDSYDPAAAYVKGDLCIYENVLYICTAPTTGTFDPSKWTATTIDNVIGDLSYLTTSHKSSLVDAVNELDSDLSNLPTEIRSGIGNYSGLKGGGHPNRVTVPITFSTPMKNKDYAVFIVISDAYPDYPYVQGYCFGGSRTANGFTATILSISSDTTTEVSGSFYWVAVRYK